MVLTSMCSDLSAAFAAISRRTLRYEHQIKDLEVSQLCLDDVQRTHT